MECRKVVEGTNMSVQPPRFQAAMMPADVPNTKLMTVQTPISPSVHGRVVAITSDTAVG
ncbi:hypothetical protein [Fodinicola feengrottensis]|uniref:hypothetical protein n=1 Tax=Fodinicola feengrottensis TaxID=435914 RepID=UPI0024428653|nr:hypothetical protein [Fodinicola feengrottensis]